MKRKNKIFAQLLALTMSFGSVAGLAACGGSSATSGLGSIDLNGKEASNDPNTVEINIYNAGYGTAWLESCAVEFMKKNPNIKIVADLLDESISVGNLLQAGAKNNTVDLFISGNNVHGIIAAGDNYVAGYDVALENLNDVYEHTIVGEGCTIEEKLGAGTDEYLIEAEIDGDVEENYYSMPWTSGLSGLSYNSALFAEAGLDGSPRTTNELMAYCDTLLGKGIQPIVYSAGDDYFSYCSFVWWAQYEGQEGMDNFYEGKTSATARPSQSESRKIFLQEGFREMFKVYEDLLKPSKGYVYKYSESLGYTEAQAYFLMGSKTHGAIMPNGSWLENEMLNSSAGQSIGAIRPMKTPIISALSDKMSYWALEDNYTEVTKAGGNETTLAEYDEKLCELVDYIDGKGDRPTWATDGDVALMRKSRAYELCGAGGSMFIPIYATAKNAAKEFLKYLATDEAQILYLKATHGSTMGFEFDVKNSGEWDSLSDFAKAKFEIMETATPVRNERTYKTYYLGGLRYDTGLKNYNFCITFGAQNSSLKTADQVVQSIYDYYNEQRMGAMLSASGLL